MTLHNIYCINISGREESAGREWFSKTLSSIAKVVGSTSIASLSSSICSWRYTSSSIGRESVNKPCIREKGVPFLKWEKDIVLIGFSCQPIVFPSQLVPNQRTSGNVPRTYNSEEGYLRHEKLKESSSDEECKVFWTVVNWCSSPYRRPQISVYSLVIHSPPLQPTQQQVSACIRPVPSTSIIISTVMFRRNGKKKNKK